MTRPWCSLNLLPRVKSCRRKLRELGIFDDERFFSHVKKHKVFAKLGGLKWWAIRASGYFLSMIALTDVSTAKATTDLDFTGTNTHSSILDNSWRMRTSEITLEYNCHGPSLISF